MCLIALGWRAHPRHDLVIAANRDEFHRRPAAAADWWADAPGAYGGRDLTQGGGWLAATRDRRLAAVTNVRRMVPPDPAAPSRGHLVAGFVRGRDSAAQYADALGDTALRHAGFNLLLHAGGELRYACNHPGYGHRALAPGVHVVSNADLDTPWPKSERLRAAMAAWLASPAADAGDPAPLFDALADRRPAADADLPDTGVGLQMERFLSSPFIASEGYGTRASTIVLIGRSGVEFHERRFGPDGEFTGESSARL